MAEKTGVELSDAESTEHPPTAKALHWIGAELKTHWAPDFVFLIQIVVLLFYLGKAIDK